MANGKKTRKTKPKVCNCGPLEPRDGDEKLAAGMTPDEVVSRVMLVCDDDTGVFFFRHSRALYLRIVEV